MRSEDIREFGFVLTVVRSGPRPTSADRDNIAPIYGGPLTPRARSAKHSLIALAALIESEASHANR